MKRLLASLALVSLLAVSGCTSRPIETGTGTTPSDGIVPGQLPD